MKKSCCWFKLNTLSLLSLPLLLGTTAHTGGCLALLGLHWSFRSNLFWNSCPGCGFDHLEYTYWSCGMQHIIRVLHTNPIALPARPNSCDCGMIRCAPALCNCVSTVNGKNAEDTGPLGASAAAAAPCQVSRGFGSSCLCCHDLTAAVLFFTALLPRHRLADKTEHPVQLNQESLPLNSPRTLSFIILSFFLLLYLQVSHQKKLPAKFLWCLSLPISSPACNVYHLQ